MITGPLPPDFIQRPLDWFQFSLLYVVLLELVVLSLPVRWQRTIIATLFCVRRFHRTAKN
jgi:hypothetical protein